MKVKEHEVLGYFHWIDENVPILKMTHREAEIGKLAQKSLRKIF
jgi:hypothetical protein